MFTMLNNTPLNRLMMLGAAAGAGKAVEATATGNPLVFFTDLARPLKSLLIPFTPQQEGTGDPSPENIRSILPWNGLKVWQSGKNILTGNFQNGVLALESGGTSYNPNYIVSEFIPVKPLTSYYLRCPTVVSSELDIVYYDKDKHYIGYTDADGYSSCNTPGRSRKTPAGCYYVRIDARNAQYNNDICINYPASVTGYVPAIGTTETEIVFPSPVYGGTLDVVSGVLTVDTVCDTFTWGNARTSADLTNVTRKVFELSNLVVTTTTKDGKYCDKAIFRNDYSADTVHFYTVVVNGTPLAYVYLPIGTPNTETVQIAYPLATPQEIQLTPAQITAIVGDNTIWSDADGSMTAVFLKKG